MLELEQLQLGQSRLPLETIQNVREGETYAQLELELNKLVDVHTETPIDWTKVDTLAQHILANEGKDLSVATWLALAWVHQHQAMGFAAGIQVLHDVHLHYWEQMSPPLKRLRARRNQIDWFLEQINRLAEQVEQVWELPLAEYETTQAQIQALTHFWQEKDAEAPALQGLANLVQSAAEDSFIEPETIEPVELPSQTESNTGSHPEITHSSSATASASVVEPKLFVDVEAMPTELGGQDLEKNVDAVFALLMKGIGELSTDLLQQPLLYRLNRVAAWLSLEQAPPAVDGVTRLLAPSLSEQETLENLQQGSDATALLRFIETRVFSHRYWLDLQRVAHETALSLPHNGSAIAQTIQAEMRTLLQRAPALAELCFQDGTPFANALTRDWLSALIQTGAVSSPMSAGAPPPALSQSVSNDHINQSGLIALIAAAQAEANLAMQALQGLEQRLTTGLGQYLHHT